MLQGVMPTPENKDKITSKSLWTKNVSTNSIRIGAVNYLLNNKVNPQDAVSKTGHKPNDSTIWEYFMGGSASLTIATHALADWPNPYQDVFPPVLPMACSQKIKNWLSALYDHAQPITNLNNLDGLPQTMLATFLMYYSLFKDQCILWFGDANVSLVFKVFWEVTNKYYSEIEILDISRSIREDFERKNKINIPPMDFMTEEIAIQFQKIHEVLLNNQTETQHLKQQLKDCHIKIDKLSKQAEYQTALLKNNNDQMKILTAQLEILLNQKITQSSPQKRLRNEESSFNMNEEEEEEVLIDEISYPVIEQFNLQQTSVNSKTNLNIHSSSKRIVYVFGEDNNKSVTEITVYELLLIWYEKGLYFKKQTKKGLATEQNFKASGKIDSTNRTHEAHVRTVKEFIDTFITEEQITILSTKEPDANTGKYSFVYSMHCISISTNSKL